MQTKFRRPLSVLLALLMLAGVIAVAPITASAADWPPPDAVPIALNTETTVNITEGGQIQYFSFIPSESGTYYFESFVETFSNGYLYDAGGDSLQIHSGGPFFIAYHLNAGETYYYGASMYHRRPDLTGSYTVILQTSDVCLVKWLAQAKAIKRLWIPTREWKALQTAIADAQSIVNNPNATHEQMDVSISALHEAIWDVEIMDNFIYRPGTFLELFRIEKDQRDGYWQLAILVYGIQLLLAPIWMPIHLLLASGLFG